MNSGTHEGGVVTRKAEAAITVENLLVKVGTAADQVAVADAADTPIGTCLDTPDTVNQPVAVQLLGLAMSRTLKCVAAGAITANAAVVTANGGKVRAVPGDNGTYKKIGTALTAAAADGDEIEVNPELISSVVVDD